MGSKVGLRSTPQLMAKQNQTSIPWLLVGFITAKPKPSFSGPGYFFGDCSVCIFSVVILHLGAFKNGCGPASALTNHLFHFSLDIDRLPFPVPIIPPAVSSSFQSLFRCDPLPPATPAQPEQLGWRLFILLPSGDVSSSEPACTVVL